MKIPFWILIYTCDIFNIFVIIIAILSDTFYEFLEEDFDVREHTNGVMQSMAIAEQLSKLAEGISLLDKELHSQVKIQADMDF